MIEYQQKDVSAQSTLSVCMMTYNHERYIRNAIEGVLSQITDFSFELIIANDVSTDDTSKVINETLKNHPRANLVKFIDREMNLGMAGNLVGLFEVCKGEFVAICDGDDVWTDSSKLQKQMNILRKNHNVVISVTGATVWDVTEDKTISYLPLRTTIPEYNLDSFLSNPVMFAASTFVFKRDKLNLTRYARLIKKCFMADHPLIFDLLCSQKGATLHFLADDTAKYNINNGGNLSTGVKDDFIIKNWISCLLPVIYDYPEDVRSLIKLHISAQYERLANYYLKEKKLLFIKYILMSVSYSPIRSWKQYKDMYWRIFKN